MVLIYDGVFARDWGINIDGGLVMVNMFDEILLYWNCTELVYRHLYLIVLNNWKIFICEGVMIVKWYKYNLQFGCIRNACVWYSSIDFRKSVDWFSIDVDNASTNDITLLKLKWRSRCVLEDFFDVSMMIEVIFEKVEAECGIVVCSFYFMAFACNEWMI